jgi:hypothetical protein
MEKTMIKSDLLGALARGYCSEKNSGKTVDPDLIEAMAEEVLALLPAIIGDQRNRMKLAREHIEGVCCDPEGYVVCDGSDGDKAEIQKALELLEGK